MNNLSKKYRNSVRQSLLIFIFVMVALTSSVISILGYKTYVTYHQTKTLSSNTELWKKTYTLDRGIMTEMVIASHLHSMNFSYESKPHHDVWRQFTKNNDDYLERLIIETKNLSDVNERDRVDFVLELLEREYIDIKVFRRKLESKPERISSLTLIEKYRHFTSILDLAREIIIYPENEEQFVLSQYLSTAEEIPNLEKLFYEEKVILTRAITKSIDLDEKVFARLSVIRESQEEIRNDLSFFLEYIILNDKGRFNEAFSQKFKDSLSEMNKSFKNLEQLRRDIYASEMLGMDIPITIEDWESKTNSVLSTIGQLSALITVPADSVMVKKVKRDLTWLFATFFIAFISFSTFILLFYSQNIRVLKPIDLLTEKMLLLATGDLRTDIPQGKDDEIGKMMYALEIFRQNLIIKERIENDLKMANEELEEFAYRTSHDLRSPLVSSISLLNVATSALEKGDDKKSKLSIEHAQNSLQKLESLIQDILDLTLIKNQETPPESIDFPELLEETIEKLRHMNGFSDLIIEKSFKSQNNLVAKKIHLSMILENLVSNAIKYLDPDEPNPFVKISTYEQDGNFVLEVVDNGLGIPEDQQRNLFQMFKRFHPKVSFGSGLGLYLMKKSAHALDGTIEFYDPGKGAGFKLILKC